MPSSEALAERSRQRLARRRNVEEKTMSGGVGFLHNQRQPARGRLQAVASRPARDAEGSPRPSRIDREVRQLPPHKKLPRSAPPSS
jgi:hypothetical protein